MTGEAREKVSQRPSWRQPMTQLNTVDTARNEGAGYKVDVSRGQRCVSAWNKGSDSLLMQFGGCLAL